MTGLLSLLSEALLSLVSCFSGCSYPLLRGFVKIPPVPTRYAIERITGQNKNDRMASR